MLRLRKLALRMFEQFDTLLGDSEEKSSTLQMCYLCTDDQRSLKEVVRSNEIVMLRLRLLISVFCSTRSVICRRSAQPEVTTTAEPESLGIDILIQGLAVDRCGLPRWYGTGV